MYRDEKEAALERAAAAERRAADAEREAAAKDAEIAALKQELASQAPEVARLRREEQQREQEQRRKQKRARREEREGAAEHPGRLRRWGIGVGIAIAVAGLPALAILGESRCDLHRAQHAPARLVELQPVRLEGGATALLFVGSVDLGDGHATRLDLLEPASGRRLARAALPREEQDSHLLAASPGRLWQGWRKGLQLRQTPELQIVASWSELTRRIPALAAGLHGHVEVDGASGAAIVQTNGGDQLLVDPVALTARPFSYRREVVAVESSLGGGRLLLDAVKATRFPTPVDASRFYQGPNFVHLHSAEAYTRSPAQREAWRAIPRLRTLGTSQYGTTSGYATPEDAYYSFAGRPRASLQLRPRRQYREAPLPGADELLAPELVVALGGGSALLFPGGAGFLVGHKDSLDSQRSSLLLSRMTPDGKRQWTLQEGWGTVKPAHLAGELVVIPVETRGHDAGSVVLGVRWRDGAVAWRYPL